MKRQNIPAIVIIVVSLSVVVSMALAAQDRFTLKAPNGRSSRRIPRDSRTRTDGDMPSFCMMRRLIRSSRSGTTAHSGRRCVTSAISV